jgi:hypothetical protein
MLSFANVVHLLSDEFAGLGAGRFTFFFVSLRSINYFLLWHVTLLDKFELGSLLKLPKRSLEGFQFEPVIRARARR